MEHKQIEHTCKKCGYNIAKIVPTEYGTAILCTQCYEVEKLNDIKTIPNQPKCPYCQSTNLKKLDVIDRGVSFGLFGFASSKVGKQWHCNNCKSDF